LITLIGKKLAKPGQEFIHFGIANSRECIGCKLRKVCDNPEVGRRYVVKSSMNKPHEKCKIHEEGVMLVEVEPAEIQAILPSSQAVEEGALTFIKPNCSDYLCESRYLCFPEGLKEGDECVVTDVVEKAKECKLGSEISCVRLRVGGSRGKAT
jgi:uncharacterized protein (UPF0179 family)